MPILQDFTPQDIIHIVNHSESRLLFLGDNYRDSIEEDQIPHIEAVFADRLRVIYERSGKSLTEYQKNRTKNYRAKYSARLQRQRHQIPRDSERPGLPAEPHPGHDRIPKG